MKRSVGLVLVLMSVAGMVFAGGGGQQGASSSAGGSQKTVITVWSQSRHDLAFIQSKVDAYNASNKDNIEVRYEIYTDNYPQAVDLVFQTGEAPDILIEADVFTIHQYSGKWAPLDPFIDQEFKNLFGTLQWNGYNVIDGKTYFIPTFGTSNRLFYNISIFKRLGLQPPKTLEEMVETSRKITSALKSEGIYGFAQNLRGATAGLSRSLMPMGDRALGIHQGFDFGKGEYDFTGYEAIMNGWKQLLSPDSAFPGCESMDIDPLRTQFAAGKIGMYFSWTHAEPGVYTTQFPTNQEWGAVQIPTPGGVVKGAQYFNKTNSYLIYAGSKNKEAAWKVYKALFLDIPFWTEYYEQGFGISLIPEVIKRANPAPVYKNNPAMLIGDTDKIWPLTPHEVNPSAVAVEGLNFYDTWAAIIWGQLDVKRGLADLTARYNKAYREGIARGVGKEIKIPNFNPMKPLGN
ncbi:MAG: extracellular solute-binding protein [Spirochaetaceae bacterium]|nr:extracellular solute-binding protein [Spirochaetaceae bacterium]